MVRLLRSHYRANSLPVGGDTPDIFGSPMSVFPHHLKKASVAIDDLDSLSYASRKHDQDFINDLNTRVIMDSAHGLPPIGRRHHHHVVNHMPVGSHLSYASHEPYTSHVPYASHVSYGSHVPYGSHVSRRVIHHGGDVYGHHHRGYSLPPTGHTSVGISIGGHGGHGGHAGWSHHTSGDHRRMSLADTAVRHAHREVDRVQRELANQEDPYFASLKRMPIHVEQLAKHRSVYVPRSSSVALPLGRSITPPPLHSHHSHHRPSYYHYYYHQEHPMPEYEDGYYRKRALYSPASLVRCLTATPVVPRAHHSRHESHFSPMIHTPLTSVVSHPVHHHHRVARSSSYHGPHFHRSSYSVPESVGQWYYRTPYSPVESSFRYGSVSHSVPHVSSHSNLYSVPHLRQISPPPAVDYATRPQPPYCSRVYSGPSEGRHHADYSYSLSSSSGLPPISPLSHGYHHHYYSKPVVTSHHVTHSPARVSKMVYSTSSSTGHTAPDRVICF